MAASTSLNAAQRQARARAAARARHSDRTLVDQVIKRLPAMNAELISELRDAMMVSDA